jgi:hypothetical protein
MLVVVTTDPENRLLPLERMLCESESADAYVELLEAIAGAEVTEARLSLVVSVGSRLWRNTCKCNTTAHNINFAYLSN